MGKRPHAWIQNRMKENAEAFDCSLEAKTIALETAMFLEKLDLGTGWMCKSEMFPELPVTLGAVLFGLLMSLVVIVGILLG